MNFNELYESLLSEVKTPDWKKLLKSNREIWIKIVPMPLHGHTGYHLRLNGSKMEFQLLGSSYQHLTDSWDEMTLSMFEQYHLKGLDFIVSTDWSRDEPK